MGDGSKVEPTMSASYVNIFDMKLLFNGLWRWKWLVLLAAIVGAGAGLRTIEKFVPLFQATMIVAPGNVNESISISGGSAGGLLSLGQSLGVVGEVSSSNISFERFKVLIGSMQLAGILQEKYQLMQVVYASSWDANKDAWISPGVDKNSLHTRLRQIFHFNVWQEPSLENLAEYLDGVVIIEKRKRTPFYQISVKHTDRKFAEFLLTIVHSEADLLIHEKDKYGAVVRKRYLIKSLESTQLSEVRKVLLSLLMKSEQESMLANTKPPYVLSIIDPVHVSAQPNEPDFLRVVGTAIGIAIAIAMALVATVVALQHE